MADVTKYLNAKFQNIKSSYQNAKNNFWSSDNNNPIANTLVKTQQWMESPTSRVNLPEFSDSSIRQAKPLAKVGMVGANLASNIGEGIGSEYLKTMTDFGRLTKPSTFKPASASMRLGSNLPQYAYGVKPFATVGNYGRGQWSLGGVHLPEFGLSESPIAQTGKLAGQAFEPVATATGATRGKALAGYLGLGGGINTLVGDKTDTTLNRFALGANEASRKASQMAGVSKYTSPAIDRIGGRLSTRLSLKSGANVAEGIAMDAVAGLDTTEQSILLDAVFPIGSEIASKSLGKVFKTSDEAMRSVSAKIQQVLGKRLRNSKGAYTTVDKYIANTRPYFKNREYAMGAMFGMEPYQDENGDWRIRYNNKKGLAGLAVGMGIKNIGSKQADDLISNAKISPEISGVAKTEQVKKLKLSGQPQSQLGGVPESPAMKSEISGQKSIQENTEILNKKRIGKTDLPFGESISELKEVQNAVKSKVNILDYFRTPDRVLKKIGLEKEGNFLRQKYDDYLDDLPREIDKVNQWYKQVNGDKEASQRLFKYLDGQKIKLSKKELKIAKEMQNYLADWADKLDLPNDRRIASYITHIFEKDFIQKEFDPDIAKLIQDRVPGSVYDPFLQQRLGKQGYVEDVFKALDAYVKRATRKYHMDQALEPLSRKAESLDIESWNYVKKLGDRVNMRPTELENLIDNFIKSSPVGYKLGQRPVSALSRSIRQMTYRGTLGLNVGSAIRNLTQGVNTYAQLGEKYTAVGYMQTMRKLMAKDIDELTQSGVLRDNFIQDRQLSVKKQFMERLDKRLWTFFDLAEKINRGSAYYGAKAKALADGKTEQEAIKAGVEMARKTQFTFGRVDTPVALQDDVVKFLAQFQSFNIKQTEFLAEMTKNKEYAGLFRWLGANTVLLYTIGQAMNWDWKDFVPFSGVLTGETKLGQTPAIKLGGDVLKKATGGTDQYGQPIGMDVIAKDLVPFFPAGTQIKKTVEGLGAYNRGYSASKTGLVRYPIPQTAGNLLKTGVLGQYATPEARQYFKNEERPLSEKQSEQFKASENPQEYYQNVMDVRDKKKQEEPKQNILEKLKSQIQPETQATAQEVTIPQNKADALKLYEKGTKALETYDDKRMEIEYDPMLTDYEKQDKLADLEQKTLALNNQRAEIMKNYSDIGYELLKTEYKVDDVVAIKPTDASLKNKKAQKAYSTGRQIIDDMVSGAIDEKTATKLIGDMGLNIDDVAYYRIASETNDVKYQIIDKALVSMRTSNSRNDMMKYLVSARRMVNGKQFLTSGVIDDLYDNGIISSRERTFLKKIEISNGKVSIKKSGGGNRVKNVSIMSAPSVKSSVTASKVPATSLKAVQLSAPSLKANNVLGSQQNADLEATLKRLRSPLKAK